MVSPLEYQLDRCLPLILKMVLRSQIKSGSIDIINSVNILLAIKEEGIIFEIKKKYILPKFSHFVLYSINR